jgi:hypothetical protein
MYTPIILAHGALGAWDEIIFLGVAVIFLSMMAISWVKNRNNAPILDDEPAPSPQSESKPADDAETDRFRLE